MTTALVMADAAERRLVAITSVPEAVRVRTELETLRTHLKRIGESLATQNRVALVGVLAEHRVGQLLAELERTPGARPDLRPPASTAAGSPYARALGECAIPDRTARRWQLRAKWLSETGIRAAYEAACFAGEEFTRAALDELVAWARWEADERERHERWLRGEQPQGTARHWHRARLEQRVAAEALLGAGRGVEGRRRSRGAHPRPAGG